jgi:uncharacterized protein Yka (UPF0111/DUF47 family)
MLIDRLIRKLLPKTDTFQNLFERDVENLAQACRALRELLNAEGEADRDRLVRQIEDLEHQGDEYTHQIFTTLSRTFITTLDREDIGALASSLDDIVDHIDRAATAIRLYQITVFDDAVRDLAEIIEESVAELKRAIPLLRDLKELERIREACVRINGYENQADKIFHRALGRLFEDEKDPIRLIKQKELLSMLESATDRCEDAAVLIENVLVKQG